LSKLSELVAGAAVKRLSAVEASLAKSNQHEINGTAVYKSLFGDARKHFAAHFLYLRDAEPAVISASGSVTWYDSRKNQPHRKPEFRLYFTHSDVADLIQPGDLAGVIRRHDNSVVIAFAEGSSTAEQQLLWLFDLLSTSMRGWGVADFKKTDREIGLAARAILSQLGIELEVAQDVEESHFALLISRYGARGH
jgi:hypothetical protein